MARPSFKEVAKRESLKKQQEQLPTVAPTPVVEPVAMWQVTPNSNQEIKMGETLVAPTPVVELVAPKEEKPLYGNKDKGLEHLLPKGFKYEKDFLVKIWRTQELEDKTLITIPSSVDVVVYDEDNFDESFKGYEAGSKTPFERVTGMKYQILHNPNVL